MKHVAIALLIALCVAVCVPLTPAAAPAGDSPCIAVLDVCNTSHAAISVNAESPVIEECLSTLPPMACAGSLYSNKLVYHPAIFAVKDDRPPIA